MKEYDLRKLLEDKELVNEKIKEFIEEGIIKKQNSDEEEIKGHKEKAENNLKFVRDNMKLGYNDWCITGCYYASYHIILALIMKKGYTSKNHLATLCITIKEFYKNGIEKEEIEMVDDLCMDYHDLLFYVESKNKREDATYSSKRIFEKNTVESLRIKAALFVDKVKKMIEEEKFKQ